MSVQMGGSTKSKPVTTTQTRNVMPMSAGEAMLSQLNEKVAQQQAAELQRAMQMQQQYEQSQGFQQAQQLGTQAGGLLQQDMAGGSLISPAQQQALQQYFQSIMAPHQQQMQQTAQQEAARRGMTVADSPIGSPYLQQLANYNAQMGGQQAGQALQLQQNNRGMQQNLMGLGQQLQQNAQQNRLALAQAQPGSYNFGNQLAQQRIASSPITSTQSGGATSKSPTYSFGLGDALKAGQTGLNMYYGGGANPATGRAHARMQSWFE
jgi:hypothetical protein